MLSFAFFLFTFYFASLWFQILFDFRCSFAIFATQNTQKGGGGEHKAR